jgi:alpha-ribazole phosphatase
VSADTTDSVLRWWWVRHAPAVGAGNIIHGTDDSPANLSDADTISRLAKLLPTNAMALTSGVARAAQTYSAFRQINPELAAPRTDSDLDEQDFGDWTGRTWDEIGPLTKRFWKDPIATSPPRGESYNAMCQRVQRTIKARTNVLRRGNLISVAHAGPIRAALALALDLSFPISIRFEIDMLSITRIDAIVSDTGVAWRVRAVNFRPRAEDDQLL